MKQGLEAHDFSRGRMSLKQSVGKARNTNERTKTRMASKGGVPLVIPSEIWQPLAEVRAQLDALCPGLPTPIEEALREIILHYKRCPRTQDEAEAFCERAKAWKAQRRR